MNAGFDWTAWNRWAAGWADYEGNLALQVGCVVLFVAILDRLLRHRVRALARHALWLLVPIKLVLSPELALPTSPAYWLRRDTADAGLPAAPKPPGTWTTNWRDEQGQVIHSMYVLMTRGAFPGASGPDRMGLLAIGWGLGIVALLGMIGLRSRRVVAWIAASAPGDGRCHRLLDACCRELGVARAPRLVISDASAGPALCGIRRRTIVLPRDLVGRLDDEGLRHVLLHEVAHVRRGDLTWSQVQTLLLVLNWMNPLVWFADRRIRELREQATDEAVVVALGGEATAYAATLVDVARTAVRPGIPDLAMLGIVEAPSALGRRVRRLLHGPAPVSSRLGWRTWMAIGVVAIVALPLSGGPVEEIEPEAPRAAGVPVVRNRDRYDVQMVDRVGPSVREQAEAGLTFEPPSVWGTQGRRPSVTTWSTNGTGSVFLELGMDDTAEGPAREALLLGLRARFRELGTNAFVLIRAPNRVPYGTLVAVMGAAIAEGVRVGTVLERPDGTPSEAWDPPAPMARGVSGTNGAPGERHSRVFRVNVRHLDEGFRRIGMAAESTNQVGAMLWNLIRGIGFSAEPPNAFYLNYSQGLLMARGTAMEIDALERALGLLAMQLPAMVQLTPWVAMVPRGSIRPELMELVEAARGAGLPLRERVVRRVQGLLAAGGAALVPLPRVTTLDARVAQIESDLDEAPPLGVWRARLDVVPVRLAATGRWELKIDARVVDRQVTAPPGYLGRAEIAIKDGDAVLVALEKAGHDAAGGDGGGEDKVVLVLVSACEIDPAGNRVHGEESP